jgi:hypothetical protein
MHRAIALALLLGLAAAVAVDASAQDGGTPPSPTPTPACITWRKEARYSGAGYDHYVHVRNGCDAGAQCAVSTNANPTPTNVRVAVGREETVMTFRGSPAYEFTARVQCTLDTPPPPPRPRS